MRLRSTRGGFTLAELLVSMAVLGLLVVLLVSSIGRTGDVLRYSGAKIEEFREARTGFESITRRVSQATLNTYWDYDNPQLPTRYERRSELRFTSGQAETLLGPQVLPNGSTATRIAHCVFFHAPLGVTTAAATATDPAYNGLDNLLNVWGYYVEFADDSMQRPSFVTDKLVPERWRFRLMEFGLPTENVETYNLTTGWANTGGAPVPKSSAYMSTTWFSDSLQRAIQGASRGAMVHAMTENVIALIVIPRLPKREEQEVSPGSSPDYSPLAPSYAYDSSPASASQLSSDPRYSDGRTDPVNQLPPVLQVTMVAIDEVSAIRQNLNSAKSNAFGIEGKFRDTNSYSSDLLLDPTKPEGVSLEQQLVNLKVNYRIFTSNVSIRSAKWSREQVK